MDKSTKSEKTPGQLVSLPEDLFMTLVGYLDLDSLINLSATCKALRKVCQQRVTWVRAYKSSTLPLPEVRHDNELELDYRMTLMHARQLDKKLTCSQPRPINKIKLNVATWTMALFRSRYLVTFASSSVVCWDLTPSKDMLPYVKESSHGVRAAWGASLHHRPSLTASADVEYKDTTGILIAYTSNTHPSPTECHLLYTPVEDGDPCPTPRHLPPITLSHGIKAIGLAKSDIAIMTIERALFVQNLTSHARRVITLTEDTVGMWIISITILARMVLVTRHRSRSCVIDAYQLPPTNSPRIAQLNDEHATPQVPQPSSVTLQFVQTVSLSAPRSPSPYQTEVDVLAATSEGVERHRLQISQNPGDDSLLEMNLQLVGSDSHPSDRTQRLSSSPTQPTSVTMDETPNDQDGYDSDSTLSTVLFPIQVVDMQLGPLGRRAVTIQASVNTNDRSIWVFSFGENDDGEALVTSRQLRFSGVKLKWGLSHESDSTYMEASDDDAQEVLKTHACRIILDELQGRLIVAADCEELYIFEFL